MSNHDRRRRVLEAALFSPDLTYAEKVLMIVVVTIRAEHVDGKRRHGSRAMGPDGRFSLHLDYLAAAIGTSAKGVQVVQRSLRSKGFLRLLHDASFGRPTGWQAQIVRGNKSGRLEVEHFLPPYGLGEGLVRGNIFVPLTYKPPVGPNQAPTAGVSPTTGREREDPRNSPPPSSSDAPFNLHPRAAATPATTSPTENVAGTTVTTGDQPSDEPDGNPR